MKHIHEIIEGDFNVEENTTLVGIITGNVTVRNNSQLTVNGTIVGNMELENGTSANINGLINGNVHIPDNALLMLDGGKIDGEISGDGLFKNLSI